jgi:hypothetical protein
MGKKQNLLTKLFAKNKSVKSTDHETGLPVQHRGKYQSKILMSGSQSFRGSCMIPVTMLCIVIFAERQARIFRLLVQNLLF